MQLPNADWTCNSSSSYSSQASSTKSTKASLDKRNVGYAADEMMNYLGWCITVVHSRKQTWIWYRRLFWKTNSLRLIRIVVPQQTFQHIYNYLNVAYFDNSAVTCLTPWGTLLDLLLGYIYAMSEQQALDRRHACCESQHFLSWDWRLRRLH